MKIRNGFVSNSSSASYIIKIHGIDYNDFINIILREYGWSLFSKSNVKQKLIKKLTDNKLYTKDLKNELKNKTVSRVSWFGYLEDNIKKDEALLKKIDNFSLEEIVEVVLERNSIKIMNDDDGIEIKFWTAMHNDFSSGMPEVLREVVLFFMFETSHKVKCDIKHDG